MYNICCAIEFVSICANKELIIINRGFLVLYHSDYGPTVTERKRRGERSTEDGVAWNDIECKCLECDTTHGKMCMSMMVLDKVVMEHK